MNRCFLRAGMMVPAFDTSGNIGTSASRISSPSKKFFSRLAAGWLAVLLAGALAAAQQSPDQPPSDSQQAAAPPAAVTTTHPNESKFFIHLAEDQKDIWTSPFHLQPADAKWLVPMGGIATALFVTDPQSSYAMQLNHLNAWN